MAIKFSYPCGRRMKVRETVAGLDGRCPGRVTIRPIPGLDAIDLGPSASMVAESLPLSTPSSQRPQRPPQESPPTSDGVERYGCKVVQVAPDLPLDDGEIGAPGRGLPRARLQSSRPRPPAVPPDRAGQRPLGPRRIAAVLKPGPPSVTRQMLTFRKVGW